MLAQLHLVSHPHVWLASRGWALVFITLVHVWGVLPLVSLILIAGVQSIPEEVYSASAVDGATPLRQFRHITLPLLRPVLLFVLVLNVIGAFQVFGQTFIVTRGGPANSTRVLVQYIYETAFNNYRMGYAAAMSWLLFLVIVLFSGLQSRLMRER